MQADQLALPACPPPALAHTGTVRVPPPLEFRESHWEALYGCPREEAGRPTRVNLSAGPNTLRRSKAGKSRCEHAPDSTKSSYLREGQRNSCISFAILFILLDVSRAGAGRCLEVTCQVSDRGRTPDDVILINIKTVLVHQTSYTAPLAPCARLRLPPLRRANTVAGQTLVQTGGTLTLEITGGGLLQTPRRSGGAALSTAAKSRFP